MRRKSFRFKNFSGGYTPNSCMGWFGPLPACPSLRRVPASRMLGSPHIRNPTMVGCIWPCKAHSAHVDSMLNLK